MYEMVYFISEYQIILHICFKVFQSISADQAHFDPTILSPQTPTNLE